MTFYYVRGTEIRVLRDPNQPVGRGHLTLSRREMSRPVAVLRRDLSANQCVEHGLKVSPFHQGPPEAA